MSTSIATALFHRNTKLVREGEISEIEIKFYSSETPNEKYRIGQKHVKGKLVSIVKYADNNGYTLTYDISKLYHGEKNIFTISRTYIEACKARCIQFDINSILEDGTVESRSYTVSVDEWLSTNTYLGTAVISDDTEKFAYDKESIVEVEIRLDAGATHKGIARIDNMIATELGSSVVYNITFDFSTEYDYRVESIVSDNIISIKAYNPDESTT